MKDDDLKRKLERQEEIIDLRFIDSGLKVNRRENVDMNLPSNSFEQSGMNFTSLQEGEIENNSSLILNRLQNVVKNKKRDNSINNLMRKPFLGPNNPLQLFNSELHQRERDPTNIKTDNVQNSMVNIGQNVLIEYDDNLASSLIKFDGNELSFDEIIRDNFKFSSPQDNSLPGGLNLNSDLTITKEPISHKLKEISVNSPNFIGGGVNPEVNLTSQTGARNAVQNQQAASKNHTL